MLCHHLAMTQLHSQCWDFVINEACKVIGLITNASIVNDKGGDIEIWLGSHVVG